MKTTMGTANDSRDDQRHWISFCKGVAASASEGANSLLSRTHAVDIGSPLLGGPFLRLYAGPDASPSTLLGALNLSKRIRPCAATDTLTSP